MLKGIIKFTQTQYEEFMKNKTITVNGITYNYDPDVLYTVEKVNVTTDTKQTISGDKDFTGKLTLNSNDVAIKKEVVTLTNSQEISGDKYFNCNIQKYGVDIATVNDIPPVVDALNSESATSSLSAKQGKVLDEKISNAIATLNGKNNSFTFDDLETLLSNFGLEKGSEVADSYLIDTNKINYNGQEYTLKNGDVFFIVDTSVPDYWYSLDDKTLYKLETTRVDLAEYAKTSDLTDYAKTSDLSDYAKTSALSDYAKLSALSDYAKLSDISTTYLKQTDIADWAKAANPPSNVVLVDDVYQEIDGSKVFLNGITTGNGIRTTFSGFTDVRRCIDDNSDTHQLSLYVEADGVTKLTHKNRSKNANAVDSYITFDSTKLKYGTSGNPGTAANNEYDVITSNYNAYKYAEKEFQKSKNIFSSKMLLKANHYYNGEFIPYSGANVFLVPIEPNTNYVVSHSGGGPSNISYNAFWDENENLIGNVTYDKSSIKTPSNAKYFVCSLWSDGTTIQIEKGTVITSFEEYRGETVWTGDNEQRFLKQEHDKSSNFYDISKITLGRSYHNTYEIGTDYIKQYSAGDYSYRIYSINGLEIGQTYTISFNALAVLSDGTYPRININEITNLYQEGIVDDFSIGQAILGTNEERYSFTFVSNTGYLNLALYNNYSTYNTSDYILVNYITLNKEKKDLGYHICYGEIIHKKDLANVALSGNYSDLINKPTIVSTIDSSSNLPTSNAVKTFVESKSFNISSVKEDIVWDDFSGSWDGTSAITLSNFANYNAFDIFFYPAGPGGDGPSSYPVPICQRVWHPSSTGDFFVLFGIRNGNIYERQVTYSSYGKLTVSNPKLNGTEKAGNTGYVRMVCIAGVKTKMLQ